MPNEVDKLQRLAARVGEENANLIWQRVQETEGAFKSAGIAAKAAGFSYTAKDEDQEAEEEVLVEEGEEYLDPDTVEFLGLVGSAVAEIVGPAFDVMAEEIDGLKTAKKEYEDKANAKISALEKVVKAQATALKELGDDTPRRFKNKERASQSEDTVLTDQEAALKGAPTQDPNVQTFDDFFNFVRGQ